MLVPEDVKNVSIAATTQDALPLLEELVQGSLPVIGLNNSDETIPNLIATIKTSLKHSGFNVQPDNKTSRFEHHIKSKRRERVAKMLGPFGFLTGGGGLKNKILYTDITSTHADGDPVPEPVAGIFIHTTNQGTAKADFWEPTQNTAQDFMNMSKRKQLSGMLKGDEPGLVPSIIPCQAVRQLSRGEIDDTYFIPVRHTVNIIPGITLCFRALGLQPVFHQFQSFERPRRSVVFNAGIPKYLK